LKKHWEAYISSALIRENISRGMLKGSGNRREVTIWGVEVHYCSRLKGSGGEKGKRKNPCLLKAFKPKGSIRVQKGPPLEHTEKRVRIIMHPGKMTTLRRRDAKTRELSEILCFY